MNMKNERDTTMEEKIRVLLDAKQTPMKGQRKEQDKDAQKERLQMIENEIDSW